MGIAPIPQIRPETMVTPTSEARDLAGVVPVQFRKQDQGETYTPSRKASRGLEDENEEESQETASAEDPDALALDSQPESTATISIFA